MRILMIAAALIGGVAFGLYKFRVDIPSLQTSRLYAQIDVLAARGNHAKERLVAMYESYFHKHEPEEAHHEAHKILATSPMAKDVVITQEYVCQIHSQRHIEVRALDDGYLEAIPIKEGQSVKAGELLFQIVPVLYKAELAAEVAERDLAQLELNYTKTLADKQGVSQKEVQLYKAKLARSQAKVDLAQAKLNFAAVKAPFDGIVDRLKEQQGSLVKEGDVLTTLSDNTVMWVYFNVPERRYLEYMAETGQNKHSPDIELVLADQSRFPHVGKIGAIEANFNNENGNIPFRADFPNPEGLLRHGQTGKVLINKVLNKAIVIPQRATFENLAKRYVYVIDKDDKVHQREIEVGHEKDDIYVVTKGVQVGEKIVLEGIRQVHEGEKVEFEFLSPEKAMANQKHHAE
ncbi:efflux RND transporter periplasmic adaptor subunit [Tundrisphaera sp. TA3]|uniref:efflux RND transporter periplasmic adaptor subunit n=1 Tax=Tundrisphaera sp. TA3 TaxID=3435775 RepID=UPI003EBE793A